MRTPRRSRSMVRPLVLLGAVLVSGLAAGCVSRVIHASGPGADQVAIEQPLREETALDRWWYGESSTSRNNRTRLPE